VQFRRPQPHNDQIEAQHRATPARRIALVSARCHTMGTRFLLLALALVLGACEEGGGSAAGSAPASSVEAISVIDLPAGKTSATLGWAPSAGSVESYAVYESRNGGDHTFVGVVTNNQTTITGSDGDSVRISVIAMSGDGKPSSASPPSPELRFHAADPAPAVAVTATTYTAPSTAPSSAPQPQPVAMMEPIAEGSEASNSATNDTPLADTTQVAASEPAPAEGEATESLESSTRALLVESDGRLPLSGLSDAAQNWMQTRVEEQFNAGVRLVGTGERDRDGLRELIWQDPSGQLFVSAGQAMIDLVDTGDTPSTFEEGVRLRATERFVALADLSGDAIGEWVIEDVSTGDVWIVDGASSEITSARSEFETAEALLIGEGDFNGDGRHELLWQHADGAIRFGHPTGTLSGLSDLGATSNDSIPVAPTSVLVAVADLNGDGNDDLVSIDQDGRLEWTLVLNDSAEGAGIRFESNVGPDIATGALELLVTLDVDDDGRAEIAWLNGDALEVWDPVSGPRDF
jgi:hypothetical protein